MIAVAKSKYMRVSPTKVRQVIDLIRGKDVNTSISILMHVNKGFRDKIKKVLDSAINNAKQKGLSEDQLFISRIIADQGPTWKRFRAVAFGRATRILKKTTHLTIELDVITK
jgi:large subunit ribosomal protein L22